MLLHFVVISLFDERNARAAKLGPKDPDLAHQEVARTLSRAGADPGKPFDPMWYLVLNHKFIGCVKVFRKERLARNWFRDLREKDKSRNFWAYWRDGYPLVLVKGAKTTDANQFVKSMAICRVRAFSDQGAAETGWKNWISGNLTAIEVYVDESTSSVKQTTRPEKTVGNQGLEKGERILTPGREKPSVRSNGWTIKEDRLVREYAFSNLAAPAPETYLRIECSLSQYLSGSIGINLTFCLRPYLYLVPNGVPFDDSLVTAPFLVSLFAAGSGAGTEDSPIYRGGMFSVAGSSYEEELDTASLYTNNNFSTKHWVTAMASGEQLTFAILEKDTGKPMLSLTLPNDMEFGRLFKQLPAK